MIDLSHLKVILRSVRSLLPYARNSRTHSDAQVAQVAASIKEFGWTSPILVDAEGTIIAGHARLLAARKLEMEEVPVIVLAHLTPAQRRALVIADNKLALNAGWDAEVLRAEMAALEVDGFDLALVGFSDDELLALMAAPEPDPTADAGDEQVPEPPAQPVTVAGDVWLIGPHRLICGDCRDANIISKLFVGDQAGMAITSPPYATQRQYDPSSGFVPIPPDEYVAWYKAVAAGVESVLAPDSSYFLNIKAHADEGERDLYVMDLVIAHRRQWGWRFVDEFCWRKTDNGVPGGWGNRFKNAWEPVFHFCRQQQIKFRADAVSHQSEDCFDYSPNNPTSRSGSGLLGTGNRGAAAGDRGFQAADDDGRHTGLARPSNVIEVKSEHSQGSHSAPFPRALVDFFLRAYSDAGDVVYDPFMGSGTTMAAAHVLARVGYGCEISPAYCDVIVRRMITLGCDAMLESNGDSLADVAAQRGVSAEAPAPIKGMHRFAKGNPMHDLAGAGADAATVQRMLAERSFAKVAATRRGDPNQALNSKATHPARRAQTFLRTESTAARSGEFDLTDALGGFHQQHPARRQLCPTKPEPRAPPPTNSTTPARPAAPPTTRTSGSRTPI